MKLLASFLGGLTGALVLNILHESIKHVDSDAPRVDLVGEEAVNKIRESAGAAPLTGDKLYTTALAGDVIGNALFYSMPGVSKKHTITAGTLSGLAAGVGAVCLTKSVGLNDAPVTRSNKAKILTVAYYTLGGIAAGVATKIFKAIL